MTQLDVIYRFGVPPSETAIAAMARLREVYGVRKVHFKESEKTVLIEYDASRLNEPSIHQMLRRAGLDVLEAVERPAATLWGSEVPTA